MPAAVLGAAGMLGGIVHISLIRDWTFPITDQAGDTYPLAIAQPLIVAVCLAAATVVWGEGPLWRAGITAALAGAIWLGVDWFLVYAETDGTSPPQSFLWEILDASAPVLAVSAVYPSTRRPWIAPLTILGSGVGGLLWSTRLGSFDSGLFWVCSGVSMAVPLAGVGYLLAPLASDLRHTEPGHRAPDG